MPLGAKIEVDIPVDGLLEDLRRNAADAADAGINFIQEQNESVVSDWDHPVDFTVSSQDSGDTIMRILKTDDLIWQWVSLGTTPTEISMIRSSIGNPFSAGGAMYFQYAGRGASYSAKSDGGSGEQIGEGQWFSHIYDRSIRARDLPGKAMEGKMDYLFALLTRALR